MDFKKIDAELYKNIKLSSEEYKKLPEFIILEENPDIVEQAEKYHLSTITKLICCSDCLINEPWALKYKHIQKFCLNIKELNLVDLLNQYKNAEEFEDMILSCEYMPIISELYNQYSEKRKMRKTLEEDISNLKNESNNRRAELDMINDFFEKFAYHLCKIEDCFHKCDGKDEERRVLAYKNVKAMNKEAEQFIENYIRSGILSEDEKIMLKDDKFCKKIIKILNCSRYRDIAIAFFVNLYENGEIDIKSDVFKDFFECHIEDVLKYLHLQNNIEVKESNIVLIETVINQLPKIKNTTCYSSFFNSVNDTETWRIIFDGIIKTDNKNRTLALILNGLNGKAFQNIINILNETDFSEIKISIHDICEELFNIGNNNEIILRLIGLMEQKQRKTQRKLNSAEREIRSKGQEIYSDLYNPIELLEDLTSSLKSSVGDIDCGLVAGKLINIVEEIRNGLSALDIDSVEDFDKWKEQAKIPLNLEIHQGLTDEFDEISDVKLRTLGFKYIDDEGNVQIRRAKICKEEIMHIKSNNLKCRDVFLALNQPVKMLEELAVNVSNGKWDKGEKLFTIVKLIRNGLSSLGINTFENYDKWKQQQNITYSKKKNGVSVPIKLRTLGFIYIDDEGIERKLPAEVYEFDKKLRKNKK